MRTATYRRRRCCTPWTRDMLEEAEVREGAPIERTERVPCTIALSKVGDTRSIITKVRKESDHAEGAGGRLHRAHRARALHHRPLLGGSSRCQ